MMEITLHLPDRIDEHAQRRATLTNQDLDMALTEALEMALVPVHAHPEAETPVASLSDEAVLALTQTQLSTEHGERLSHLAGLHAEDALSADGQQELLALVGLYQFQWMRQAGALAESVRRGLLPAMHS